MLNFKLQFLIYYEIFATKLTQNVQNILFIVIYLKMLSIWWVVDFMA